ncbi:MAG: nucleoside triphosphate pyrophosphatase [Candidatus Levybacteria bacterium]|nr:nucleoside triphosphate pyrophosphatase [Candidatus Levybacteria bacterium]
MKTIILASGSPRRKELLEKAGLKFRTVKSRFKEYLDPKADPHELTRKLSLKKALVVSKEIKNTIIIAADTIVVINGKILGKPKSKGNAMKMLMLLSGKKHSVITAFTIIDNTLNKIITRSMETKICMRKININEIKSYIETGEPLDKAGAYAIQERGSIFIKKIDGDFFNAVGLPIYNLMEELKKLGVKVL